MSLISLEEQLRLLDEQIQLGKHDENSDDYKALIDKRRLISNDISGCQKYIRGSQEYLSEKEVELRRTKRESEEGLLNSSTSKSSQEKRAYAKMLAEEIIPRLERDVRSTQIEIQKRTMVLSGVPWQEAIEKCQRMKDGFEEPEEELTLF
ncbi:hypothetical protein ACINKY_21520 [Paenibacillus illinoisensis]|uniref:Uncharacterized protein n=1 Tax=Paenibacillus illinoisensis TaxID=59845 RepID=A0ABW8HZV2_9BACL